MKILDHERNVTVPSLVKTQDTDLGVPGVNGEEGLDLPGHSGRSAGHPHKVLV